MLHAIGVVCTTVEKGPGHGPDAVALIERGDVDLVINVPRSYDAFGRPDGFLIRRAAVDAGVPLVTDLQLARAVIEGLRRKKPGALKVRAWQSYFAKSSVASLEAIDAERDIRRSP